MDEIYLICMYVCVERAYTLFLEVKYNGEILVNKII